jgi:hypothetical protein
MDELEFERGGGISEKLPKSNDVKPSIHKPTATATKPSSYLLKDTASKVTP